VGLPAVPLSVTLRSALIGSAAAVLLIYSCVLGVHSYPRWRSPQLPEHAAVLVMVPSGASLADKTRIERDAMRNATRQELDRQRVLGKIGLVAALLGGVASAALSVAFVRSLRPKGGIAI